MSDMSKFKVGANTYNIKDAKSRGVSLTWAQYQALSYEEQHNGTAYYITDMDAVYPVDHELNANSRNAVANDIVTPHILAMENVLGAKNLLPLNLDTIKSLNSDGTWNGNVYTMGGGTITVNTDNKGRVTSIVANGTFTGAALYLINESNTVFESGKYIINGVIGGSSSTYDMLYISPDWGYAAVYDGDKLMNLNVSRVRIDIMEGTHNNVAFYPMIRPAGTDPTYVPYAMTNEQLTDAVNGNDYVEIVADGVKDNVTLFNELFALIDHRKITPQSVFIMDGYRFPINYYSSTKIYISGIFLGDISNFYLVSFKLAASNSRYVSFTINSTSAITANDESSSVPSAGYKFRIVYY